MMNYYYLISGLPELSLDSNNQKIDFYEIIDTIQRNLNRKDENLFRYLLYQNDNRNLVNVLFEKHKGFPKAAFVSPAIFSEQEIRESHKNISAFPDYMTEFLDENSDLFNNLSVREIEDRLLRKFYEETEKTGSFISKYYRFEEGLRKLFSAYNHSYFDFLKSSNAADSAGIPLVGKGNTIPSQILKEHPYAEAIGEAISSKKPYIIENLMNRIKWDYLEEVQGFFGIEQVLVYMIRLLIVARWNALQPDAGKTRFDFLKNGIKNNVHTPKTNLA